METDPIKEVEADARNLRLAEQAMFRSVLDHKKKKFKRLIIFTIAGFTLAIGVWLVFHCMPLALRT